MPVRRALAAVLALPILVVIYLPMALRRGPATRIALTLGIGGLVVAAAVGVPSGTVGAPPVELAPLAASALGPAVGTGQSLASSLIVDFDAPMDASSVVSAVRVDPSTEVELAWSEGGRRLAVKPAGSWRPATLYTVTVGTAARDRDGRNLATPLRAAFLTRARTTAQLTATSRLASGVALDSGIVLSFDRPVSVAGVSRLLTIRPEVRGQLLVATDGPDGEDPATADNFVWEPDGGLASGTRYTVALADGLLDEDGVGVTPGPALAFTTTLAPSVVRFRPRAGTDEVERAVDVSVRFTKPMDRATTRAAFSVEVNGTRVAGKVAFAEDDTVLVFDPKSDFPYGATVVLRMRDSATSADGTPLDRSRSAGLTVVPKPKPAPKRAPVATTGGRSGGSSATPSPAPRPTPVPRPPSTSWVAAEKYLLTLLNCTRGGGWVLADGSCSSPGGSGVAPLRYHAGISDRVARPYARKLATAGACSHFFAGDPGDRLRAAGYTGYQWAENLSCRYFRDPRDAAVSLVRFFQSEKFWSPVGGHYVNMMNRQYTHAGIGLWVSGGHLNFVINFYTP